MKYKIVPCSLLLMMAFADLAVARNSLPNNSGAEAAGPSNRKSSVSMKKLGYQNLRDASQWSRLTHGRAFALSLKKKKAHSLGQDDCFDCGDSMFPGGPDIGNFVIVGGSGGGCGWTCCFKQCVGSAMSGTGTLCASNCTACGVTGNPWPCAICVGCGAVGFAAIEFCSLHCCVNPGC